MDVNILLKAIIDYAVEAKFSPFCEAKLAFQEDIKPVPIEQDALKSLFFDIIIALMSLVPAAHSTLIISTKLEQVQEQTGQMAKRIKVGFILQPVAGINAHDTLAALKISSSSDVISEKNAASLKQLGIEYDFNHFPMGIELFLMLAAHSSDEAKTTV